MKTKSAIIFLISFLLSLPLIAQDKIIKGEVIDSLTQKPLKGVVIKPEMEEVVFRNTIEYITDSKGSFSCPMMLEGMSLVFTLKGYETKKIAAKDIQASGKISLSSKP